MTQQQWWKGGVLYQIYPRSFQDSNGDGIGDLVGITSKLDYVASLDVDGIWLSPFFTSPMKDFGYDVSDYRNVDSMFGTLDDFCTLIARAHSLGLKVIIDQVLSHTSDQHPWFQESRVNRVNAKSSWYVWADPRPDGTPPNNWLAVPGGSAWTFDSRRCQYYLHNFLTSQPDLNFHNPEVRQAQLENMRFWLELGVDGFRFDTVNFYFHDKELRDNPAVEPGRDQPLGYSRDNPHSYQWQQYNINRPENIEFLKAIRQVMDCYPGSTTVGEVGGNKSLPIMKAYTSGGDKLHMAYTFDLLQGELSPAYVREVIQRFEQDAEDAWPCWALSNHDVTRIASRWGNGDAPELPKLAMAMLLAMRGSVCLYQGEELGLPEAEVPFERLQDPFGMPRWPEYKGRDGCRTPMPWRREGEYAGFSQVDTWLPLAAAHRALSVESQEADPASLLNDVRRMLAFRRAHRALQKGAIELVEMGEECLAWLRSDEQERLLCVFNFSMQAHRCPLPAIAVDAVLLEGSSFHGAQLVTEGTHELALGPYQAAFLALK
ncbi:alpha-glucosidase family protein [Phytohalomonas tamaricis]|uniref:alpha-glucosidase family protein n=1 Tax=Phytohalomonas tamaricis TaxID=2081032 RepID=UPI000D0BDEF1|nr:alpha-glucosidase family protein [Phytohalomonas tamaricis]